MVSKKIRDAIEALNSKCKKNYSYVFVELDGKISIGASFKDGKMVTFHSPTRKGDVLLEIIKLLEKLEQ